MAFNPFNVFRRNQKILFAMLTVVVMFMFVLSFGQGDFFSRVPEWLGRNRRGGEIVAVIDGSKLYETELGRLDTRRRLANQYMSSAGVRAAENLRKYVFEGLNRVSPENKPIIQQALAARPLYMNPQSIQMAQFGLVTPDQLIQDREQTIAFLMSRLTDITTARTPKENDLDIARSMQALIDLDLKLIPDPFSAARTGHYFSNQSNAGNRDLVEFALWLRKADQLDIHFTTDDVDSLVASEFFKRLTVEDLRDAERELRGKRGYTSDLLKEALADEFRVRAAQTAVIGHAHFRPNARSYEAPYDFYQFYREQTSPGRFGFISIPAENYLPLVTDQPTETELRDLFNKAKNKEPNPALKEVGLREPRKLKLDWLEVKGTEPYYQQAAIEGMQKAEVMAKVGGFLVAPLGGLSAFPLVTAAAPLTVPDAVLAAKYQQYTSEHNATVRSNWLSTPIFGSPQPLDPSVIRPVHIAVAVGMAAASLAGPGNPFAAGVAFDGLARSADRKARLETLPAAVIVPIGPGLPAAALATIASQTVAVRPLPLDAVRGLLMDKAKEDFARAIANTDLTKFTEELTKISDKKDVDLTKKTEEARAHVDKFVKDRGLRSGASQEFRDQFTIADDPGLAALREKKPNDPFHQQPTFSDPAQFGRRFFFEPDPVDFRRERPSEGYFKPQPYPQFSLFGLPRKEEAAFLVWRVAEQPAESPRSFEVPGAKEKTIAAWKLLKAREMARKAADELAKDCGSLGNSFVEIEQKLRDKRATFAGRFASPAAGEKVKYFEIDDVAPIVSRALPMAGREQVGPFAMPPSANIPYPTVEMVNALVDSKEKPLSTAIVLSDRPEDRHYVAVLLNRQDKSADEFGLMVYGPTAAFGEVGPAVNRRHQEELRKQARDTALALIKAEFRYDKENETVINKKSESSSD